MWYDLYGFEGKYQINKEGQIKSLARNIIISQRYDNKGYLIVSLINKEGKQTTKGVHRLLMETFCPVEDMENLTVNHINHIKDDNRLENLEWISNSENIKEAYSFGLHKGKHKGGNNKKAVRCVETGEVFESGAAAARSIGIKSRGKIGDAINSGKRCGGYHWEYYTKVEATEESFDVSLEGAITPVVQ